MHSIIDIAQEMHPDMQVCFLDAINDHQQLNDEIDRWRSRNQSVLLYCLDDFKRSNEKLEFIRSRFEKFYFTTPGHHHDEKHIPNVDNLTKFSCGKHQPRIDHSHDKKYKFLFLVGKTHGHRLLLLAELAGRGILDKTLLSLRNDNHAYGHVLPKRVDLPEQYEWPDISALGGFRAGWSNGDDPMAIAYVKHQGEPHPLLYGDTAYSIVSETSTEPNINYITEKTWTPIIAEHLIVCQGNKSNNNFLESLGFSMTNDIIPDYDETDHSFIADLCGELERMPVESVYRHTAEQRSHNRSLALDEEHWKRYHRQQLLRK